MANIINFKIMNEYDHLHELAELNYVAAKEENHPEIYENGKI